MVVWPPADKCGMPVNYSRSTERGWFTFFASLIGVRTAEPTPVFDDVALEAGRPSPIRKLSQRAEVNRFWNPAPPRKGAS